MGVLNVCGGVVGWARRQVVRAPRFVSLWGVVVLTDCTARERMVVKKEQVYQKAFVKRERGGEGQLDDVWCDVRVRWM